MRTLFWKIFLTFWITIVLIVLTGFFLISRLRPLDPTDRNEFLTRVAAEASVELQEGGHEGLVRWLEEQRGQRAMEILVVDENRTELLGRPLPPDPRRRRMGRPARPRDRPPSDRRPFERGPGRRGSRELVDQQTGRTYRLFVAPTDRSNVISLVGRILAALLISGLLCLFLARTLTRPLRQLQRATQRIAGGDLSARVDMADRRDEIADLGRDFDKMAKRIDDVMTSQRRLLRDLSHELRSPLARLQVALELARKNSEGQAEGEFARIETETERLNELIGEILTLVRLESGASDLERAPFDLRELLDSITSDAQFEAAASQRAVRLSGPEQLEIVGDQRLLGRAIENVVRNAIRYTAEGTEVHVEMEAGKEQVTVRVADNGPGVSTSALEHLFDPFYRETESRTRDGGGYGVGLAIAKRTIEAHGGTIEAKNRASGGLVVSLSWLRRA